ncbi:MAG: PEP-CTERM sorting domain-containing protein [Myxococcota bacterium]
MKKTLPLLVLASAASLGLASGAGAATYGSYTDPTGSVSYLNVSDVNGLFGAPSVSLDSLDFTPTTFQASCTQCTATTSDTLNLDIAAVSGKKIDQLEITEGLDYFLQSFDPSGLASVNVTATLTIGIVELDGVAVSGINSNVSVLFSPSGTLSIVGFGINPPNNVILGTSGVIDVDAIVAAAGRTGDATRLRVAFGNVLTATHDGSGGLAQIRKRDADFVSLTVDAIARTPEPSTALLILGGLSALAAGRRKS